MYYNRVYAVRGICGPRDNKTATRDGDSQHILQYIQQHHLLLIVDRRLLHREREVDAHGEDNCVWSLVLALFI